MCFNMMSKLAAQMLSSGLVLQGCRHLLGGFLACLFAHICVFPLLLGSMVRLAVLAIEELLGILVENRLDLAQIDLGALCCRSCNMNSFMSEGPYIKCISFFFRNSGI